MEYDHEVARRAIMTSETAFVYEIVTARSGEKSVKVRLDGRDILLHSSYDPVREADKTTSGFDDSFTVIVVGGYGLGYHVEALIRKTATPVIMVFEKDPGMVRLALETRPAETEKILSCERVMFFDNTDILFDQLKQVSTRKIGYYFHRPSFELHKELYENFKPLLQSFIQKKNINMATFSRFERIWARNIILNAPYFTADGGISSFFGRFKGMPAVLVAAGPSLEDDIKMVKEISDRAIIVAVDSVLKRLDREGIVPDMVFSVDPQIINYYFFYLSRGRKKGPLLVYEPSANHLIRMNWDGPAVTFDSIFPIIQWLNVFTGEKGRLDMGGSVSTTAFDFMLESGADPVIMTGQDFSFRHNLTHAADSLAEYYFLKRCDRIRNMETLSIKFSSSTGNMKLMNNSGQQVNTDRRLLLFYWWFEKKCSSLKGTRVYNTSRHGAAIKGAEFVDSSELSAMIRRDFKPRDKDMSYSVRPVSSESLVNEAVKMSGSLSALLEKINTACSLAQDLYRQVRTGSREIGRTVRELDAIDKYLEGRKSENFFIQATMQRIILNLTEGYEDFLSEEEKENRELGVARKSILLYDELKKSVEYNIRLFGELACRMGDGKAC